MQELGETRDAMSVGCCEAVYQIAAQYTKVGADFWLSFAAKPHIENPNAIVQTFDVFWAKPPAPILGVLWWHYDSKKKDLFFCPELSLPYDIPVPDELLSDEYTPRLAENAKNANVALAV